MDLFQKIPQKELDKMDLQKIGMLLMKTFRAMGKRVVIRIQS